MRFLDYEYAGHEMPLLRCPVCDGHFNHIVADPQAWAEDALTTLLCEGGHRWFVEIFEEKGHAYLAARLVGDRIAGGQR